MSGRIRNHSLAARQYDQRNHPAALAKITELEM